MKTFEEALALIHSIGATLSNLMEGPLPPKWVAIIRKPDHLDRVGRGASPALAIEASLAVKDMTVEYHKAYRAECVEKSKGKSSEEVLSLFTKGEGP